MEKMESWRLEERRRVFSRTAGRYTLMTAVLQMALILCPLLLTLAAPELLRSSWTRSLCTVAALYLCALPIARRTLRRFPACPPEQKPMLPGQVFRLALIAVALVRCFAIVGRVLSVFVVVFLEPAIHVDPMAERLAEQNIFELFFVYILAVPLAEELIFRKLLLDRLRIYGERPALLVSALLFAFYHGNLVQFCYTFFLGGICAYAYLRSGRLREPFLIHICVNVIGSLLPRLLNAGMVMSLLNWLLVITGLIALMLHRSEFYYRHTEQEIPKAWQCWAALWNPGMLAALALFLLLAVLSFVW